MISLREITIGIPSVSRPEELDKTLSQLVDDCDNILVYLNGVKEKKNTMPSSPSTLKVFLS